MLRRTLLKGLAASAPVGLRAAPAAADDVLKMGVSIPLTGAGFNAVGRQLVGALKLYVQQHGTNVPGERSNSSCVMTGVSPTTPAASCRR
jgi:hypothetical protein